MGFELTIRGIQNGGVTNTGDAAVGDVASGKTFSSSALTNATGTLVAGNATVPVDAPIQPPQAFVDGLVSYNNLNAYGNGTWSMLSVGAVSISQDWIDTALFVVNMVASAHSDAWIIDLQGNALNQTTVNLVLSRIVAATPTNGGTLNISGGTSSALSGQGLIDKATLEGNGWTVTVN